MNDIKDKAKDFAESAEDIARDQLDTFKKLSREKQILVLAFAGVVALVLTVWLLMPGDLKVAISTLDQSGIPDMENRVIVENLGNEPITNITIILNEKYQYSHSEVLDPGKTLDIGVTQFKIGGKPDGDSPEPYAKVKNVKVSASGGTKLKIFVK